MGAIQLSFTSVLAKTWMQRKSAGAICAKVLERQKKDIMSKSLKTYVLKLRNILTLLLERNDILVNICLT